MFILASNDEGPAYPLPADEEERLRDLYELDVLDTPAEEVFDRLTALAQSLLEIRVAAVSLLDRDRQWFKSCQGLTTSGTPREDSICTYAILDQNILTVDDTRDHPEYQGTTIDGWEIRSYASAPLISSRGHVVGVFCIFDSESRTFTERDQSVLRLLADETQELLQQRHRREFLEDMAYTDPVTELPNRYALERKLNTLNTDPNGSDGTFELFWVGVDRFTRINDTLGYQAGDEVLHDLARRFQNALPNEVFLTRMGGDEFLILLSLTNDDDRFGGREMAQSLFDSLQEPFEVKEHAFHLSLSIGATRFSRPVSSPNRLLSQANRAMVRASMKRGNTMESYCDALRFPQFEGLEVENDFHEALYNDELELHFQPIYELQHSRVCATEALLRWEHSGQGSIQPPSILTLAENTGLVLHLEEWVLEKASSCAQRLRDWSQHDDYTMSANVSASSFMQQQDLVELVEMIIDDRGLEPDCLTLEITETLAMKDIDHSIQVMNALKQLGIRLAIDDFGTGYSSLSHLTRFPVDKLKIDRTFVDRIGAGSNSNQIVKTIIGLGHELDLTVVAEGVETDDQLEFLAKNGCDRFQGWLKSRALPLEELTARSP